MFIWLALFLLDVAVRRIALDLRAMARRIVSSVRSFRRERKVDETLERLRLSRQKLREQLSARSADEFASRRYEAKAEYDRELPVAPTRPEAEKPPETRPVETVQREAAASEQPAHIQRLLKAKRKAAERRHDDETGNKE
jgi:hypothetical protein